MYFPLQIRLPLFFTLILALALWFFGSMVYGQAEQRAYHDLDDTLSSRAGSVQIGKDILARLNNNPNQPPITLPSVDALGTGGVAIEVFDNHMNLLATTAGDITGYQTTVTGLGKSPIPWDAHALDWVLRHPSSDNGPPTSIYRTITYQDQRVRVYTLLNNDFSPAHIIQTARSERRHQADAPGTEPW